MADKKVSAATAKTPTAGSVAAETAKKTATAAEYSVQELVAAAASVCPGVSPDCITAALRLAKVETATKARAKEIVEAFIKRPVSDPNKKEAK